MSTGSGNGGGGGGDAKPSAPPPTPTRRPKPSSSSRPSSSNSSKSRSRGSGTDPKNRKSADRTEWIIRALKNNPEIDDLRGRVTPLARAIQFAEAYNRGKGRANLDKAVITQLVLQYLEREGLRGTLRLLETESNAVYQPKDIEDTRLTSLLHVSVKDTDQLWSLALQEANKNQNQSYYASGSWDNTGAAPDSPRNVSSAPSTPRAPGVSAASAATNSHPPYSSPLPSHPPPPIPTSATPSINSSRPGSSQAPSSPLPALPSSASRGTDNPGDPETSPLEELLISMRILREDEATAQDINMWEEPANNIIFETGEVTAQGESAAVVAGSLNKLVEHLTPLGAVDLSYMQTFLSTYTWFTKPETLLLKLTQRYNAPREEGITDETHKKRVLPVQLRVINVLKRWIEEFFEEFEDHVVVNIKDFVIYTVETDHPKQARTLLTAIESRMAQRMAMLLSDPSRSHESSHFGSIGAKNLASLVAIPVGANGLSIDSISGHTAPPGSVILTTVGPSTGSPLGTLPSGSSSSSLNTSGGSGGGAAGAGSGAGVAGSAAGASGAGVGGVGANAGAAGGVSSTGSRHSIGGTMYEYSEEAPRPVVPKNIFAVSLTWLDVDEEEIARQLTLIEFDTFRKIRTSELLLQAWNRPKFKHRAPNVLSMIARFNAVSQWVGCQIVRQDKVKTRARVMQKLILIADHLRKLNNFNTLMAFVAMFNTAAIFRLKHTKSELSPKSAEMLAELCTLMDTEGGSALYRKTLESTLPPAIPYLGIFLTDLTFAEDGNPDTHMGLINFRKSRTLYSIISRIHGLQQKGYNLHPVFQIQSFLRDPTPRWPEKELYKKSMIIEPRSAERSAIE